MLFHFPEDSVRFANTLLLALQPRLQSNRFGLYPVRSPLLRVSLLISFPPLTEMSHFSGSRSLYPMYSDMSSKVFTPRGFPHSEISGS